MPSGPIHHEDGVGARCHLRRDFVKMPLHGLSVAARQDEGRTDAALGTDGAENIGRLRALIERRPRSGSSARPSPGNLGFLSDPRFVLPPNLYRGVGRELAADFRQLGGKVFLKSSMANSFCP